MNYRQHKDFNLSEIGIGCYALSGVYGRKDPAGFQAMLARACELGVNYFDTADGYGGAEAVLGEALKPFRSRVYIATKASIQGEEKPHLTRTYLARACENSLKRLQTDRIDLYQVHYDDAQTPVEETLAGLQDLVQAGKIRHFGVCHLPAGRIETYCRSGQVFSILMELSAAAREARQTLLPLARQYDAAGIAFSVTGRGLLTGAIRPGRTFQDGDIRQIDPLFQRERFESGLRIAARLAELGGKYGKTPAQTAIAWALGQPGILCALTGPSSIAHLEENLGGSGWRISPEDLQSLEAFFEQEQAWLAQAQASTVHKILCQPLPADPGQAFTDLVYAIETAILLGFVVESQVVPLFMELYGAHESKSPGLPEKMAQAQRQLAGLIPSGPG